MENISLVLTEEHFRTLVSGHEIAVEGISTTGEKKICRMILQDIGWDVMNRSIDDAQNEFYWKNTSEYKHGYDAGLNGPNEKNSHYTLFALPDTNRKWQAGYNAGERKKSGNG